QPHGRVLTRLEYQRAYANEITLAGLLTRLTGNKHLLFMGCSLNTDRTLEALIEINNNAGVNAPPHSAILPLTEGTDRLARRQQLNAANIHPIWYPHEAGGDHDQPIEDLLVCLIEGGLDG
ncbi:MAG: SIR2 family protein, partial [Pseudomonadota bacterium]